METRSRLPRWPILFLCLGIGIAWGLGGWAVLADDNENGTPQEQTQQSATKDDAAVTPEVQPAEVGGLVAAVDKDTGELRAPTAEEMKKLDEDWRETLQKVFGNRRGQKPFIGADGRSHGMLCGPEMMEFSVATIGPDGKVRIDHVTGAEQAEELMKNTATSKQDETE